MRLGLSTRKASIPLGEQFTLPSAGAVETKKMCWSAINLVSAELIFGNCLAIGWFFFGVLRYGVRSVATPGVAAADTLSG